MYSQLSLSHGISFIIQTLSSLRTKHLQPLFQRLKGLLIRRTLDRAKHELGLETPIRRNVKLLGQTFVNDRVVVLQVGTKAERFQTGPCLAAVSLSVPLHS